MNEPINWEALARHLAGEAAPEEVSRLESSIVGRDDARRQMEAARSVWDAACETPPSPDVETALRRVQARLRFIESGRGPVTGSAMVRRRAPWYAMRVLAVAAVVVGMVALGLLLRTGFPRPEATPLRTVSTERGQRATLWLDDGTVVRLNVASSISYPAEFDAASRTVRLEGEAFFDVSPDAARPFRIETQRSEVVVLGTSFGVRADPADRQSTVVVASGVVGFGAAGLADSRVILTGGQMGILDEGSSGPRVEQADLESALSWLTGTMVFENAPFSTVMRELERVYDLEVYSDVPAATIAKLNARFGTEPLPEILDEIGSALGLSYSSEDRAVTFRRREEP